MTYSSSKAHKPSPFHPWRSGKKAKPVEPVAEEERACAKCGKTKPLAAFIRGGENYPRSICGDCRRLQRMAWREANRERLNENNRIYRESNSKKINARKRRVYGRTAPAVPVPAGWWGTIEVSAELNASVRYVRNLCIAGKLIAIKSGAFGRPWAIDPESVRRFKYTGDGR